MTNPQITPDLIATTIEKAADFLEENGWTYGMLQSYNYETSSYNYCTIGALKKVEESGRVLRETEAQLACALSKLSDDTPVAGTSLYPRIAKWNDRHRNGKNVIKKLRLAAAKIRAGECS